MARKKPGECPAQSNSSEANVPFMQIKEKILYILTLKHKSQLFYRKMNLFLNSRELQFGRRNYSEPEASLE